jgi:hypothetical protein
MKQPHDDLSPRAPIDHDIPGIVNIADLSG